jgi:hypothetical protein
VRGRTPATSVAPIAGIAITHDLRDGITLEAATRPAWTGTPRSDEPVVIRHELGTIRRTGMHPVLDVPPWCTFHVDGHGEPASLFHPVFGEVERLLTCEDPGRSYVVQYGSRPCAPVEALQSELTAFSFALAARGLGFIAHSCAFTLPNGTGVLCPGVSGAGKTTLARLLRAAMLDCEVLTDDRAIVTLTDRLTVCGSPWPGAAGIAAPGGAPLDVILFIRHAPTTSVRAVRPADAFRRVVNTLSMPLWEPARCGRALDIVHSIVTRPVVVEAAYPPTADAARWLCDALVSLSSEANVAA